MTNTLSITNTIIEMINSARCGQSCDASEGAPAETPLEQDVPLIRFQGQDSAPRVRAGETDI